MKTEYDDQYFFDNGYFVKRSEVTLDGAFKYDIIEATDKWKQLFDTAIAQTPMGNIITPDLIKKVIENGDMKRTKVKRYKKLSREEKDRRKAEKHKRKYEEERRLKNANRQS